MVDRECVNTMKTTAIDQNYSNIESSSKGSREHDESGISLELLLSRRYNRELPDLIRHDKG